MADGSAYVTFKTTMVTRLAARLGNTVRVSYEPPRRPEDLTSAAGTLDWVGFDDGSASLDVRHMSGPYSASNPLVLEEDMPVRLVIQSMRPQGTQAAVDAVAIGILGDVLAVITTAPDLADTSSVVTHHVIPSSWTLTSGSLPSSDGHATRIELTVVVRSRLHLT
jgi:hypothetical protein